MAESSWPTVAGTRAVTDDQYELMCAGYTIDGIIGTHTDTTVAYGDSSGRQVKIRAGKTALVGGHGWYSGSTDVTLTIAANSSGSTRIDMVVLGLDRTTWAVNAYIVQGTPGAGIPSLTRGARGSGAGKWEIPIASVTVVNGASTIASTDVTNIGWYSGDDMIAVASTASHQPPVADYSRMRHTDTGNEWTSVSGAWRVSGLWRASTTLSSNSATLTVSSIPTYLKQVRVAGTFRGTAASSIVAIRSRVGGDSGNNYHWYNHYSQNGGAPSDDSGITVSNPVIGYAPSASGPAGVWSAINVVYSGWDSPHASALAWTSHGGYVATGSDAIVSNQVGLYFGSSTRNSLVFSADSGNLASGTQVTVEGWE